MDLFIFCHILIVMQMRNVIGFPLMSDPRLTKGSRGIRKILWFNCFSNNNIIIVPLLTPGSIYSTYASEAEKMPETNN